MSANPNHNSPDAACRAFMAARDRQERIARAEAEVVAAALEQEAAHRARINASTTSAPPGAIESTYAVWLEAVRLTQDAARALRAARERGA
jgi:hypothetical protein